MAVWYMVKNINAADKSASNNSGQYHHNNGADDWDMVNYDATHDFNGSEDYALRLSDGELGQNINGIFYNYAALTVHEAGDLMDAYSESNRKLLMSYCYREFGGQLRKSAWNATQQTSFKNQVKGIFAAATTGDVRHMKDAISDVTPVAPLTQAMLDSVDDMCDSFLERFPDGQ